MVGAKSPNRPGMMLSNTGYDLRNLKKEKNLMLMMMTMNRILTKTLLALPFILTCRILPCACFAPVRILSIHSSQNISSLNAKLNNDVEASTSSEAESKSRRDSGTTKNPLELASWYAVEAFGKAFGGKKSNNGGNIDQGSEPVDLTKPPSSLEETLRRIQLDNDRSYFLSGQVDELIYDEDCTFADPFVSFDGRRRFIDNLSNLGSFITNYDAKMMKFEIENDGRGIVTKVNLLVPYLFAQ